MANRQFEAKQDSRRNFLARLFRGLALGGAGAVGGTLAARGRQGMKNQICETVGRCRQCQRLAECGLPQAMSARQLQGRP